MEVPNWLINIGQNQKLKCFLDEANEYDIFVKKLNQKEFKRINLEYPNFIIPENNKLINENHYLKNIDIM